MMKAPCDISMLSGTPKPYNHEGNLAGTLAAKKLLDKLLYTHTLRLTWVHERSDKDEWPYAQLWKMRFSRFG